MYTYDNAKKRRMKKKKNPVKKIFMLVRLNCNINKLKKLKKMKKVKIILMFLMNLNNIKELSFRSYIKNGLK